MILLRILMAMMDGFGVNPSRHGTRCGLILIPVICTRRPEAYVPQPVVWLDVNSGRVESPE